VDPQQRHLSGVLRSADTLFLNRAAAHPSSVAILRRVDRAAFRCANFRDKFISFVKLAGVKKFFVRAMTETAPTKTKAWQPLTPRGVAAFAHAKRRRLLRVQLVFAVLAAITVVWFLRTAWFPTVREAIRQLPTRGEINRGKLAWSGTSPQLLAEGRWLAFSVDTNHTGEVKSTAHFQIEFGSDAARVYSLFGFRDFAYLKNYVVAFNRTDLEPWWGAWEPPILWMTFGGVIAGLLFSWAALATVYAGPVWLAAFFANRNLNFWNSWKLAGAALMPGALLMTVAFLFYGLGILDLIRLLVAFGAHWIIGWVYLSWAVAVSPKIILVETEMKNPFVNK
jgi:hypothetical protein